MSMQNVLSTLLGALLVFNATCACASTLNTADAGPHAHHEQSADILPGADCTHSDCSDCEKAVSVVPGKNTTQPTAYKFDLDDIEWSVTDLTPIVVGGSPGTIGPPFSLTSRVTSTPVRRFDLQLE